MIIFVVFFDFFSAQSQACLVDLSNASVRDWIAYYAAFSMLGIICCYRLCHGTATRMYAKNTTAQQYIHAQQTDSDTAAQTIGIILCRALKRQHSKQIFDKEQIDYN